MALRPAHAAGTAVDGDMEVSSGIVNAAAAFHTERMPEPAPFHKSGAQFFAALSSKRQKRRISRQN
jgi:hypothetical protein